jgi:uncharacterized protein YidB (DUF937 family)
VFDALIREAGARYGLGEKAAPLLRGLLGYIFQETPGGLAGFVGLFQKAGLGDVASSWIGGVSPKEISPERVESVLGASTLERLAAAVGLGRSVVLPAAAYLLPRVVNVLTRDGIPSGIPAAVAGYLASPGHPVRPEPARLRPMRWLAWLLLPILALLAWRWCAQAPAVTAHRDTKEGPWQLPRSRRSSRRRRRASRTPFRRASPAPTRP